MKSGIRFRNGEKWREQFQNSRGARARSCSLLLEASQCGAKPCVKAAERRNKLVQALRENADARVKRGEGRGLD